jgi:hypothetical protein
MAQYFFWENALRITKKICHDWALKGHFAILRLGRGQLLLIEALIDWTTLYCKSFILKHF